VEQWRMVRGNIVASQTVTPASSLGHNRWFQSQ
jgi:hypothetical protein